MRDPDHRPSEEKKQEQNKRKKIEDQSNSTSIHIIMKTMGFVEKKIYTGSTNKNRKKKRKEK